MEESRSLTLNETALQQQPDDKKPQFIFEWLAFLDNVLVAAHEADIKSCQQKLVAQLVNLFRENLEPPARRLLARNLANLFSVGDTNLLFDTVNKCNDIIKVNDDSPSYLPTRLAAICCLESIYEKLGRMMDRSYEETVTTLVRSLKSAESQTRLEIMNTLGKICVAMGTTALAAVLEVWSAARTELVSEQEAAVRAAAAHTLRHLLPLMRLAPADLVAVTGACIGTAHHSDCNLRCAITELMGALTASTQAGEVTNLNSKPKFGAHSVQQNKKDPPKNVDSLDEVLDLPMGAILRDGTSLSKGDIIKSGSGANMEFRVSEETNEEPSTSSDNPPVLPVKVLCTQVSNDEDIEMEADACVTYVFEEQTTAEPQPWTSSDNPPVLPVEVLWMQVLKDEDEEMKAEPQPSTSSDSPPVLPVEVLQMQVSNDKDKDGLPLPSSYQPTRRAIRRRRASAPVSSASRSRSRSPHVARHLSPRRPRQLLTGGTIVFDDAGERIAEDTGNGWGYNATRSVSENAPLASNSRPRRPQVMRGRGRGGRRGVRGGHRGVRGGRRGLRGGLRGVRGARRGPRAWRTRSERRVGDRRGQRWKLGDPIVEVFKNDGDIDPRVLRIAAEDERKRKERMRARVARDARRDGDTDEDDSESEDGNDGVSDGVADDTVEGGETFQWLPFSEPFRGREEVFRVQHTGSVNVHDTPYSAFRSLWPDELLELIVKETNLYATNLGRSYSKFAQSWYDTNADEILCLFAFWMMMAIHRLPKLVDYFSTDPLMQTEVFRKLFSKNRYKELTRALHFVETNQTRNKSHSANPTSITDANVAQDRLHRLRPIITFLNSTFQANYILSKNICIDESLTLWKGKLNIKQYIRTKAARFGIKSFELCDSSTGYLWAFRYYTGNLPTLDTLPAGVNKSTGIVMELMRPLLHKGHKLFMDNWYNSPFLARWLKRNGTDCVGTLRLNRADVPCLFSHVPLVQGQFIARHSGDVCLVSWHDKKRITTLSTYHKNDTALARIRSKKPCRPLQFKPQVVLDYNRNMGGVDLKDQMLEPYLMERKKESRWYMKLFKRLVNCSVLNSRIIYASSTKMPQPHLAFRKQLVRDIMARHLQKIPCTRSRQCPHARTSGTSGNLQPAILNGHWPLSIPRRLRCVVCYRLHRRNRQIKFQCSNCKVPLCIECFETYHTHPNFTY